MKHDNKILKAVFFACCLLLLILTSDTKADQLSDVSFSADGSRFLSRNRNKISVWETDTGKRLRTFETATTAFKFAAFLPDGKTVLAVNYKAEMLWLDIESGEIKNKIQGKANYPYAISADGETVAHSSTPGKNEEVIELYDTRSGELKKSFRYASDLFICLSFFPDGEKLLAVGDDFISVISLKTEKIEKIFDVQMPIVNCAVSNRGDSILGSFSIGLAENTMHIYSLQKKQKYLELEKEYKGRMSDIGAVGYSPTDPDLAFAAGENWQTLYKAAKGSLIIWNTKTGKVKQNLTTVKPLASAAFSADGKTILVQEVNGCLTLFNTETGAAIRKYGDKAEIDDSTSERISNGTFYSAVTNHRN